MNCAPNEVLHCREILPPSRNNQLRAAPVSCGKQPADDELNREHAARKIAQPTPRNERPDAVSKAFCKYA
jgi:hypothetical protein